MKKRILNSVLIGIIAMTGLQNVAMASGYQEVTLDDFKKVEPVYLMITGATRNCVMEHDCDGSKEDFSNSILKSKFKGTISAQGAKMTVAKELLVVTEDTLNSSSGDLGVPADKIEFDFDTEFYKGFILKIYLNEDAVGKKDDDVYLDFDAMIDGKNLDETLRIPLTFAKSGAVFIEVPDMANGRIYGAVLPYELGSTLEERNDAFKKRLNVGSKLLGVERWARGKYLSGEIDANLLIAVMEMSKAAWTKTYSEEFNTRFNRRYTQLKFMSDREKISPSRLYGAFNMLMKANK